MSLKDAVMDIVEEMVKEADDCKDASRYTHDTLKSYARSLKAACKSAGDNPSPTMQIIHPQLQHVMEVEKAKAEFRKTKQNATTEEQHDGEMVYVEGGPGDASYFTVNPQMPIGARIKIDNAVYQLRQDNGQRCLVYDESHQDNHHKKIITGD